MTLDPAAFEHALLVHRGFGRVFCDWRQRNQTGEPALAELDAYAATVLDDVLDDQSARDGYRQVSAQYAGQLVAFWLAHNLAEGTPPVDADADASIVKPFFALFAEGPVFFTSTATKTLHDRDAGIVVADRTQIGMLWFADDE